MKYSSVTETVTFPAKMSEQNRCIHLLRLVPGSCSEACLHLLMMEIVMILKVQEETRCARGGHYYGCDISHMKN
jgi:hypothetical protein